MARSSVQTNDDEAFKAQLLSYVPRLRGFARTLSGSVAAGDDLAQDTVLLAWRARMSFQMGSNMEGWLFRILRNTHISGIRREKRSFVTEAVDAESVAVAVDDPSAGVALNDMRRALNRLTLEQREALILVGASGWSYEEAAEHAGCPVGTMKSRVFRARRMLASYVETGKVMRDALPAGDAMPTIFALAREAEGSGHRQPEYATVE